jgi:NitT/TauT family transport system permease protein
VEPTSQRWPSRLATFGLPTIAAILFVGLWWLATIVFQIREFMVPAPPDIVDAFIRLGDYLLSESLVTLWESVAGFLLATVSGLLLAIILVASPLIERAMLPLIIAANSIPKIALAPLFTVWMGFDLEPKIAMSLLVCFFPIVVAAMAGLTSAPAELHELATSLSASRWKTFLKIRIPWALPQIFVGLKVAVTLSVIGAVVGEFTGGDRGLGRVISSSGQNADTPLAFAAITLLAVMSVGLYYIVVLLERLALPWHRETTSR